VDLGIVNIATTSEGDRLAGARLNRYRKRQQRLRKRLQAKKTSSARRLLKKRRRKERRFAADVNHQISKRIVAEPQRTGRGIAVEQLTGIRERVRLRKPQRAMLHSWAFAQLGGFLAYKAQAAGVVFVHVDPAHTSQTCHACGWVDTNATDVPKQYSSVGGVASLGTLTTMQQSTSPPAVSSAGAKSCARTRRPP
jgi:putative transposase